MLGADKKFVNPKEFFIFLVKWNSMNLIWFSDFFYFERVCFMI